MARDLHARLHRPADRPGFTSTLPDPLPMTEELIIAKVREFIVQNFLYMHPGFVLGDDDRFLERRILDSMAVMELVAFLRGEFGVRIPEEDILEANLGSLRAIARYVRAQHEARGAA